VQLVLAVSPISAQFITVQMAADAAVGKVLKHQHLQASFLAVADQSHDVPVPEF
jgi:hypothetical protein